MNRALKVFDSIPRDEWIDFGYMLLIPSVLVVGLPLFILWFRP